MPIIMGQHPAILDAKRKEVPYAIGIAAIRHEIGLTAAGLAKILGVSMRTVNGWENGKRPTFAALWALHLMLDSLRP